MIQQPSIAGVKVTSSADILSKNTKLAWLIWAASGFGKTTLAGSLDALTQKYDGKRTLYIAVESAEGGGAATIRKLGVPLYVPKDYSDLFKTLGYLRNDKSVGGVVLDSATELYKQHIKPATLKYPCRENIATRAAGVLTRSDYQVAGELTSQTFRQLMLLTTHEDPAYRKHLIVTATDQLKTDPDNDDKVIWMGPDLPGRMSREAVQMFQQVSTVEVKAEVINGKRIPRRYLVSSTDGIMAVKDRFDILPQGIPLRKNPEDTGEDLLTIYEKYWMPAIEGK